MDAFYILAMSPREGMCKHARLVIGCHVISSRTISEKAPRTFNKSAVKDLNNREVI